MVDIIPLRHQLRCYLNRLPRSNCPTRHGMIRSLPRPLETSHRVLLPVLRVPESPDPLASTSGPPRSEVLKRCAWRRRASGTMYSCTSNRRRSGGTAEARSKPPPERHTALGRCRRQAAASERLHQSWGHRCVHGIFAASTAATVPDSLRTSSSAWHEEKSPCFLHIEQCSFSGNWRKKEK